MTIFHKHQYAAKTQPHGQKNTGFWPPRNDTQH